MNNRIALSTATIAIIGVFLGCGGSVSLTNVWTDPGYTGQPKKNVLVVGLAQKPQVRTSFEYQLKHEFTSRGVAAMASVDGIPRDVQLDKQTFAQYFGNENLDAVLVTGLVSADTTDQYTPGNVYAVPVGYYNTWHGYYGAVYAVHREPGYWTTNTKFVLESNLYDVATEKLIWRGISRAVNPENAMEVIEELSKILVNRLGQDGLVTLQGDK